MGISDADPAGTPQDSPEVQQLKARIAELEGQGTDPKDVVPVADASAPTTEVAALPAPATEPVDAAGAAEAQAQTPQVEALNAQLEQQRKKIDELTSQAMAQKDPATADSNVDVKGLLNQLVEAQTEYRSEISALRTELAKVRRVPPPTSTVQALSAEQLLSLRMREIDQASHYCPACGALYKRERECTGKAASPHPAVEVVSTDELKDPPDPKDKAAVEEYQTGHTAMQYVDPEVNATLFG